MAEVRWSGGLRRDGGWCGGLWSGGGLHGRTGGGVLGVCYLMFFVFFCKHVNDIMGAPSGHTVLMEVSQYPNVGLRGH